MLHNNVEQHTENLKKTSRLSTIGKFCYIRIKTKVTAKSLNNVIIL